MRWVNWSMRHRVTTMVLATLFFFGSVALIPLLPTGFIPPDDNSQTAGLPGAAAGLDAGADPRRRRAGAPDGHAGCST